MSATIVESSQTFRAIIPERGFLSPSSKFYLYTDANLTCSTALIKHVTMRLSGLDIKRKN